MGAILLLNGAPGKRFCLKNSEIMIHQPLGGVKGQATDIDIEAKRIIKTKKLLNTIISSKTNKSLKQVEQDVERDYFMDSETALNYGIIDKII
jgi:ATP-dependent Clp protease protease subunit